MLPPADKKILEKARPKLTGSISLAGSDLLDQLRSREAITENQQQIIEDEKGNRKQVARLLDFLLRGGVDTLDKFIYSLRDSDYTELATDCLRRPNKPDEWDDDTAAGGQTGSTSSSSPFPPTPSPASVPAPPPSPPSAAAAPARAAPPPAAVNSDSDYSSDDEGFDVSDSPYTVIVQPCTEQFYSQHRQEAYRMDQTNKGKALIVNVNQVKGHRPRSGTHVDRDNLRQLFEQLQMKVTVLNDDDGLTAQEIEEKVSQFAAIDNHQDSQCCVLALLSHGEKEHIYGTDAQKVNVDKLRSYLTSNKCDTLIGKPKLTLVQACRGTASDDGVDHPMGADESDDLMANHGDEIVGYPTHEGYKSWRHTEQGSWYISALVDVFEKHAHHKDVVEMLTMVNGIVRRKLTQTLQWEARNKTQMSLYQSSLDRKWYFFPGIQK